MSYDHQSIDGKWQKKWAEGRVFEAETGGAKEKCYLLVEFPFPSGEGLHVGHPRSYTAIDVLARKRRMEGKNVLFSMGWDAFGLPAENYAIKTGNHPATFTEKNINTFRRQLKSMGFSFDWTREVNTADPSYYKWTQWMFLEMFKAGLAYKAEIAINWCPKDLCGLANEEVVHGACERCGTPVEKKLKSQWMIAITKYADRLLSDLDTVDYLPKIKKQQQEWIGKSEGAELEFPLLTKEGVGGGGSITVFTTRPDTIFGVTYVVLAPEHPLVNQITTEEYRSNVDQYVASTKSKTDMERGDETRTKTGVFTGSFVKNPANGESVPVWIADYVLGGYGTGAVMAVPQHDERDRAFSETFNLPIIDRPLIAFDEALVKTGGRKKTTYRLRDWVFSRQRYWGEPIPLVHCEKGCAKEAGGWVAVPAEQLPVELPNVENYQPTINGESPLSAIDSFVNTTCPTCGGPAKRETDTMPNWAGSSWYFLRYTDAHNNVEFASKEALNYWMPVDIYNGGMEHTTLHLLYSRFWNKVLFDRGLVPTSEPYARRHSHGLIMSEDGTKMSKSKGNVVNPDEIVQSHGADTLRVYELFMGPFEEAVPWSTNGVIGVRRFLDKTTRLIEKIGDTEDLAVTKSLHRMIAKVSEDIENFRFNTAVSQLMMFVNTAQSASSISKETFSTFLRILTPFAPHVANDLFEALGGIGFLEQQPWPIADASMMIDDVITLAVQVNGKLRGTITVAVDEIEEAVIAKAKAEENVAKWLVTEPKKVIVVKGKMVNFVV